MGKYELKKLYKETDIEKPMDLKMGDRIWSVASRVTGSGNLLCTNPINFGQDEIAIEQPPKEIIGLSVFSDAGLINPEITKIPIYLEITSDTHGYFKGEVVDEAEWPNLEEEKEYYGTNREDSIEWDGTPQKSGSSGADRRRNLLSKGDVRSSKNDLIK